MAAVLACGHGASLSHSSAAQARGFMPGTNVWVDVTVPTPGRRARTGIIVHTTRSLTPADVGAVDRIPCTSPAARWSTWPRRWSCVRFGVRLSGRTHSGSSTFG